MDAPPQPWPPAVSAALGDAAAAVSEPLAHNDVNAVTLGIWRVRGAGRSLVCKVVGLGASPRADWAAASDPRAWNYWRREPDLLGEFLEGALDGLPLRAPGLAARAEVDGGIACWVEDVAARDGPRWSIGQLLATAERLGLAHAALVERRPAHPSLSRGFLRAYVGTRPVPPQPAAVDPRVAAAWPAELRDRLAALWQRRDELIRAAESAPRVFSHLDVWPENAYAHDGETVLVDWAFAGDGALGEDLANLVPDSIFDGHLPPDVVRDLADQAIARYLGGLRDGGWRGDRGEVVRAIHASGAAKYAWLAPRMLGRLAEGGRLTSAAYDPGTGDAEILRRRAPVLELLCDWAEAV